MKRVIKTKEIPICSLETVSDKKFYGVHNPNWRDKNFISRDSYGKGKYSVRCLHSLTAGNVRDGFDSYSLKETIDKILSNNPNTLVIEFDSVEELLNWLLNNEQVITQHIKQDEAKILDSFIYYASSASDKVATF